MSGRLQRAGLNSGHQGRPLTRASEYEGTVQPAATYQLIDQQKFSGRPVPCDRILRISRTYPELVGLSRVRPRRPVKRVGATLMWSAWNPTGSARFDINDQRRTSNYESSHPRICHPGCRSGTRAKPAHYDPKSTCRRFERINAEHDEQLAESFRYGTANKPAGIERG